MSATIIFRPKAEEDVQHIHQWYESQQPGLGDEFIRILREKLEIVREYPEAFETIYKNFNHLLKYVLKGAASDAIRREPFKNFYKIRIEKGVEPNLARLTVARKIGAIILVLWKKGVSFNDVVMLKITA